MTLRTPTMSAIRESTKNDRLDRLTGRHEVVRGKWVVFLAGQEIIGNDTVSEIRGQPQTKLDRGSNSAASFSDRPWLMRQADSHPDLAWSGTDRGPLSLSDELETLVSRQVNDIDGVRSFISRSGRASLSDPAARSPPFAFPSLAPGELLHFRDGRRDGDISYPSLIQVVDGSLN